MEHFNVTLLYEKRSPQIAAVRVYDSDDCRIELTFAGRSFEGAADDFFESFCCIRRQLEAIELTPNCYAVDLRSYPSGMSRSMGGLKLYRLKLGSPTRTSDIVHMFDVDENVVPVTVDDQRRFFDAWLESLR